MNPTEANKQVKRVSEDATLSVERTAIRPKLADDTMEDTPAHDGCGLKPSQVLLVNKLEGVANNPNMEERVERLEKTIKKLWRAFAYLQSVKADGNVTQGVLDCQERTNSGLSDRIEDVDGLATRVAAWVDRHQDAKTEDELADEFQGVFDY